MNRVRAHGRVWDMYGIKTLGIDAILTADFGDETEKYPWAVWCGR